MCGGVAMLQPRSRDRHHSGVRRVTTATTRPETMVTQTGSIARLLEVARRRAVGGGVRVAAVVLQQGRGVVLAPGRRRL